MRDKIISLLDFDEEIRWGRSVASFIESSDVQQLSEKPGHYTAGELRAELNIRTKAMARSGMNCIGLFDLKKSVAELNEATIINNYAFKGKHRTAIVYLDKSDKNLVGAVLV